MRREQRLRRRDDFAAVRRRGRGPMGPFFGLRGVRTDNTVSRIGFAVPKRVGTAVVRNRVRRRLRAALAQQPLAPGWDIVIGVRPAAAQQHFAPLAEALAELLRRGKMVKSNLSPVPIPKREWGHPRTAAAQDGADGRGRRAAADGPAAMGGRPAGDDGERGGL